MDKFSQCFQNMTRLFTLLNI